MLRDTSMDLKTQTERVWTDRQILIRLSEASKLLNNCAAVDINVSGAVPIQKILLDLCGGFVKGADRDFRRVSRSSTGDGDLFDLKFSIELLDLQNKELRHAAIKLLLCVSSFLKEQENAAWTKFLHHLWTAAKHWAFDSANCNGHAPACHHDEKNLTETDSKQLDIDLVKGQHASLAKLGDGSGKKLLTASSALDLLQRILRTCVQESDGPHDNLKIYIEIFVDNICALTSAAVRNENVSSDLQFQGKLQRKADNESRISPNEDSPRELFLGSLLRLVSSATNVATSHIQQSGVDNLHEAFVQGMESMITMLSPVVLAHDEITCESISCISFFLCHKFLMIMLRLAECFKARLTLALSCLISLQQYGGRLLDFSVLASESENYSLDDSPFLASLARGHKRPPSLKHLQRQALYVFFKIIASTSYAPELGNQVHPKVNLTSRLEQTARQMLKDWLDRQAWPATLLPESTSISQSFQCISLGQFAKAYVRFYCEEDDLMFKMLLLLVSEPLMLTNLMGQAYPAESTGWNVVMALTTQALFHAFIASIDYSSSVLVDFLISVDCGALCLQYLLRSMRGIVNSWPAFMQQAPYLCTNKQELHLRDCQARESGIHLFTEKSSPHLVPFSNSAKRTRSLDRGQPCSILQRTRIKNDRGGRQGLTENSDSESDRQGHVKKRHRRCCSIEKEVEENELRLERTMNCLLQVKISIERLHRRSLFPYNPSVLLKRLDEVLRLVNEFRRRD